LAVYKKIRTIIAKDRKYFLDSNKFHLKISVKTNLGEAIIENVKHLRQGEFEGLHNWGTLRVSLNNKTFFVKIDDSKSAKGRALGFQIVNAFLKKQNYKFNGFKISVAPLQIAHDFLYERGKRTMYATDFFNNERYILVEEISNIDLFVKATGAVYELRNQLASRFNQHKIGEVEIINTLYDKATNSLILFDLDASLKKSKNI